MGGSLDWAALDSVAAYLEIDDLDLLIDNVLKLKEYQASKK